MSEQVLTEIRIPISCDDDVLVASQEGRALVNDLRFSSSQKVTVTIAISEVARNIIRYARKGEIVLSLVSADGRRGIVVIARDTGPGISDIEKAMQDGYSTGKGLGSGLPGAKRLMDEFVIDSELGRGTTVTMKKWEKS